MPQGSVFCPPAQKTYLGGLHSSETSERNKELALSWIWEDTFHHRMGRMIFLSSMKSWLIELCHTCQPHHLSASHFWQWSLPRGRMDGQRKFGKALNFLEDILNSPTGHASKYFFLTMQAGSPRDAPAQSLCLCLKPSAGNWWVL